MISSKSQGGTQRLLYSQQHAAQAVNNMESMIPTRIFPILYPLWEVEVSGMQKRSRDYEMVELFLSRSIAEGGFCSIADLSAFLGLSEQQVSKGIHFSQAMGHIQGEDGNLTLTKQGRKSLQDGIVYRELKTQRKLYFEAFQSRPIPKGHYRLRILSETEAMFLPENESNYWRLFSRNRQPDWQPAMLSSLVGRADRDEWNLPEEISDVEEEDHKLAYLPMYIIQVTKAAAYKSTSPHYVVLTRVRDLRDHFFEGIVNDVQEIKNVFLSKSNSHLQKSMKERLEKYGIKTTDIRLIESAPDAWRATLPAIAFLTNHSSLNFSDIGRFEFVYGYCLQIWCDDPSVRREAALDKAVSVIGHWQRPATQKSVESLLENVVASLQVSVPDIEQLLAHASERRNTNVLSKLEELGAESVTG